MVYVKMTNHIVHRDWIARKYCSDFKAMKEGLNRVNRKPSERLKKM